jgi:multimeric flavodoxin WrbA
MTSVSPSIPAQSTTRRRVLFLLASSRKNGNSEQLARAAAAKLPADVEQNWLRLADLHLPGFADIRHAEGDGTYAAPGGDAAVLMEETLAATDLVFVAPLYWYSLPSLAKAYLDHWSGWMRVPGVNFRARMEGRKMWSITALSDENQDTAKPLVDTLRYTAQYMKMHWAGALLSYGNRPGDVLDDRKALDAAQTFLVK